MDLNNLDIQKLTSNFRNDFHCFEWCWIWSIHQIQNEIQSSVISHLEAITVLGVCVTNVCLRFDYFPFRILKYSNITCTSQTKIHFVIMLQVKCLFEIFYYQCVVRNVLIFHSKNMYPNSVRHSLVEEFLENA